MDSIPEAQQVNVVKEFLNSKPIKTIEKLQSIIGRPIYQFDLNGFLINTYPNAKRASLELGVDKMYIYQACIHKTFVKKQYYLSYQNVLIKTIKKVYQYTEDNILVDIYKNPIEASKKIDVNKVGIYHAAKTGKPYKGFIWKYE